MKKSSKNKPPRNKRRKTKKNGKAAAPAAAAPANNNAAMELVMCLKTALEHQQAGRLDEAETFYRKALQAEPGNPIANQLLGKLALDRNAHEEAADFFAEALEKKPDNAEIRNNLGNCLVALGQYEEAIECLEEALVLDPDYAQAHNNLGAALTGAELYEEAVDHINRSLQLSPDNAFAHSNLGNAFKGLDKFDEAVGQYNRALELNPEFPDAYYNLGVAFEHKEMFEDAIGSYKIALKLDPENAEAHYNLGNIFTAMGVFDDAKGQYDEALKANPSYVEAHNNMGTLLEKLGLTEEAEESWKKASEIDPEFAESDRNLAGIYKSTGRIDEAIAMYKRAIAIKPDFPPALVGLGAVLGELDRLEEAEQCLRRAIELDEDSADAHMNLAILLLMTGDLANGWEEYEWRLQIGSEESPVREFSEPRWKGEPLEGKSILLWGEQGIGDELRHSSVIPDMFDKGATVSIETTPRLADLFARSFPQATVRAYPFDQGASTKTQFDYQCPFGSLPRILRPTVESFAAQRPSFLIPDQGRKEFWQGRFAEVSSRPKIGINWRSMNVKSQYRHYYASVEELAPVMTIPGVDFVNMMIDATEEELGEFESRYGVKLLVWDDINLKDDQDDVAALNANLDMVVSCLSAVTEMSGALGVPTLGFLGGKEDFCMLGTGDAIWQPSNTYFTKTRNESWQPIFEEIAQEIRRTFDLPS